MIEHHPLVKEFPAYRQVIHELKLGDSEFRALFDEYHQIDRRIYRIDQDIEPVADDFASQLKRRRLFLEDRLLQMVRAAARRRR
jgi:uncharacterized protein YdcH (DUF465 family)